MRTLYEVHINLELIVNSEKRSLKGPVSKVIDSLKVKKIIIKS